MTFLALNLVLAVVWVFLFGEISLNSLLVGFVVGFAVVALHQKLLGSSSYSRAVVAIVKLMAIFSHRLWLASLQLVRDILRPEPNFSPAIVAFHTGDLHSTDLAILANLISLTPGSLVMDADARACILFVHCLYGSETESVKKDIALYVRLLREVRGYQVQVGANEGGRAQ